MNGVIGMTNILMDTELDEEQVEIAQNIKISADALLTIINDILDFSKIETGKLTIEPLPINLRSTLEQVGTLLTPSADQNEIELLLHYDQDTPENVIGDQGRIRQILTNLVNNAIKFTNHGHVKVSINCLEQQDNIARLRFEIQDTGIGIPEDRLEQIFGKFTQADASTTRKFGGTGLGLAISKQLVELMGGSIGVTSELEKGSTFWVELPLPLVRQISATSDPIAENLSDFRILIVDDDETNQILFHEHLLGYVAHDHAVASKEAALLELDRSRSDNQPYQIVLIGDQLPDSGDRELIKTMQEDPANQELGLIHLCSLDHQDDNVDSNELKNYARLEMPVKQQKLLDAITNLQSTIAKAAQSAQASEPEAMNIRQVASERDRPLNILVAEDNRMNQKVALALLKKAGYEVTIANNGLEALDLNNAKPFDLILMDCQMPEMDGFEATAAIRKLEQGIRHTPIVAMTANAMRGDREKCLAAGMDEYITKPVQRELMIETIEKVVNNHPQQCVATASIEPLSENSSTMEYVNKQAIETMFPDCPDLILELVGLFLEDAPNHMEMLESAIVDSDSKQARFHAHTLKGMAGNLQIASLQELCYQLEIMGRDEDLNEAPESVTKARDVFNQVENELNQYAATLQ